MPSAPVDARFTLSWPTLALQFLPPPLRRLRMAAWLCVLLGPYAYVHTQLLALRERLAREAAFNGQTALLEAALNYHLPAANGAIAIVNLNRSLSAAYLHARSDNPNAWLKARSQTPVDWLYARRHYIGQPSFSVQVAAASGLVDADVRPFVERYRPAARTYDIDFI